MVVIVFEYTTTCRISCEFESCSWPGVFNTTLCKKGFASLSFQGTIIRVYLIIRIA